MDYEEATILAAVLLVLWRARPAFDRRAAFFDTRFSIGWTVSVAAAIGASIWLGEFAYKHVNFSNELWWQFELHGEASRFLRGTVGAVVPLLLFAFARLIGRAPHETSEPTDADLDVASRIIASQDVDASESRLPARQSLLFDDSRRAFIMYGVQGRSWVALRDPVGPPEHMQHHDSHVPRALRRLRRRTGLLRSRQRLLASLRGLRA